MSEGRPVAAERLEQFAAEVLAAMGARLEVAAEVARHLVRANLCGHDSHGVIRLPQYVAELDRGELVPAAEPRLLQESKVTALFDAGRGLGQHSTMVATEWVLEHARGGLAAAAVRHSMHIGRLGHYAERVTEEGLLAIVTVGMAGPGAATVAPFGGAERFLGTNPWCLGVPAAGRPPLIFDAATSTVAEGKVRMARARGTALPEGLVRDAAGNPTTDPEQLYAGGTQTVMGGAIAGHKGYGLSLASALFGGLAMIGDGAPTSGGTGRFPEAPLPGLAGVFLAALDPAAFGDPDSYRAQVAGVLGAATRVRPVPGSEGVLVPGDVERASRQDRERSGLTIPEATWRELEGIGLRFGVAPPG